MKNNTVVSRIYAPRFATLALVESVGGAYMRDLTFYLANTPPFPVPCLDVDITDRSCRTALATSSEARWSRSTDRGWPQRRQRRFPSIPRVCPFNVLLLIDADMLAIDGEFLSCSMDAGSVLTLPRGP